MYNKIPFIFILIFILISFTYNGIYFVQIVINFIGSLWLITIISWHLSILIRDKSRRDTISSVNRAVIITGCDSGFGNMLAQRLDTLGFHVFAGCLMPDGENAKLLRKKCTKKLRIVKLDVKLDDDIKSLINQIKSSELTLWTLVNNAGICYTALNEWGIGVEIYEEQHQVNTLGAVRMTKHCLPLLRTSKGRVVNVTCLGSKCMSILDI